LQIAPQDIAALFVLAQRLCALADRSVEPHQQPMRFLAHRIEPRQLLRRLDRGVAGLRRGEAVEHIGRENVQPRAFDQQPILEGAVAHAVPIEQRPAIDRCRLGQLARLREAFELDGVCLRARRPRIERREDRGPAHCRRARMPC
jgi:hypothetical protein